jgi:hypothetical protein
MRNVTFLGALMCMAVAAAGVHAGQPSRLSLWATESIGMNDANYCGPLKAIEWQAVYEGTPPTLTEADVTSWNPADGSWGLAPSNIAAQSLRDHCFVLTIDGTVLVHGIALASETARLTVIPTLFIDRRNESLVFQLTSGNKNGRSKAIHTDAIDAVLGNRANLQQQMLRLDRSDDAALTRKLANEWVAAVQKLIDEKTIVEGMRLADISTYLGWPNVVPRGYSGPYFWRFESRQNPNPVLGGYVKNEIIQDLNWINK